MCAETQAFPSKSANSVHNTVFRGQSITSQIMLLREGPRRTLLCDAFHWLNPPASWMQGTRLIGSASKGTMQSTEESRWTWGNYSQLTAL